MSFDECGPRGYFAYMSWFCGVQSVWITFLHLPGEIWVFSHFFLAMALGRGLLYAYDASFVAGWVWLHVDSGASSSVSS